MSNLIKDVTLFAVFFIPSIALAASCAPNDTQCQIAQKQIQAMENIGIKPSSIAEAPGTDTQTAGMAKKSAPTPFVIPTAGYQTQTPDDTTTTQQQTTNTQKKRRSTSNMFVPITDTSNQTQTEQPQEFVFQPPKSPLQPQPIQTSGITYQ